MQYSIGIEGMVLIRKVMPASYRQLKATRLKADPQVRSDLSF
jgi:hypothetical protein